MRSVGGSYSSPYAYMSPEMATSSWTPGPFESGVISLQGRQGALGGRRSSLGECRTKSESSYVPEVERSLVSLVCKDFNFILFNSGRKNTNFNFSGINILLL